MRQNIDDRQSREEKKLWKFSVRKPYTVVVAVAMVLVLGFVSWGKMTTDLLPDISLPYLVVMTSYSGGQSGRSGNDGDKAGGTGDGHIGKYFQYYICVQSKSVCCNIGI